MVLPPAMLDLLGFEQPVDVTFQPGDLAFGGRAVLRDRVGAGVTAGQALDELYTGLSRGRAN